MEHHASFTPGTISPPGSLDLIGYMASIQRRTAVILENAQLAGRYETALKAIREARSNIELISKLAGLEEDHAPFDLTKLTAEELAVLLRHSLSELPERDQSMLRRECPELNAICNG